MNKFKDWFFELAPEDKELLSCWFITVVLITLVALFY